MSSYLVVKNTNSDSCSYLCKDTHTSVPYLKVDTGYLDLTTETTTGTYLVVKNSDSTYRPKKFITGTQDTSYIINNGYSCESKYNNYSYISATKTSSSWRNNSTDVNWENHTRTNASITDIVMIKNYFTQRSVWYTRNTDITLTLISSIVNNTTHYLTYKLYSSNTRNYTDWEPFEIDNWFLPKTTNLIGMHIGNFCGTNRYIWSGQTVSITNTGLNRTSILDFQNLNNISFIYKDHESKNTSKWTKVTTSMAIRLYGIDYNSFSFRETATFVTYFGNTITSTNTISTYTNEISYAFKGSELKTSYWTSSNTQGAQYTTALTSSSTRESTYSTEV